MTFRLSDRLCSWQFVVSSKTQSSPENAKQHHSRAFCHFSTFIFTKLLLAMLKKILLHKNDLMGLKKLSMRQMRASVFFKSWAAKWTTQKDEHVFEQECASLLKVISWTTGWIWLKLIVGCKSTFWSQSHSRWPPQQVAGTRPQHKL